MKKVVLGLSGGVDSAVAARLLQQSGYAVSALYLDIGTAEAREDACASAAALGVDLAVEDVSEALERLVCAPFARSYRCGETPNPCILCNPAVKFAALCAHADAVGAEYVATGHYARAENGVLLRGMPANDQSYMLCRLTRAQLSRLVLPLGGYEKAQVRALAREFSVPVADKPDSMEICFVPDKDYAGWLRRRGVNPPPGEFVRDGVVVGRHEGIHRWTVGQRIPGVYDGEKLYVQSISPEDNRIAVCTDAQLHRTEFFARDFNWLIPSPAAAQRGSVKVRHSRSNEPACTVYPLPDGGVRIVTDTPVRAPARGQSAVVYDGARVLGGGFIV
ncbi:MAG: tRNA 2-thiouridine(34) synthase MnmA [Ruminococcaceae bacterium]|nr:tRNA 2-thiouridine(34) synthase MnmA [Oscillospiraceae bacterium]